MMQLMQSLLRAGAQQHYRVLVVAEDADPSDDIRSLAVGRVEDIARRVVSRVMRQIEDGQDTEPGEIVATWLREGESTPLRR